MAAACCHEHTTHALFNASTIHHTEVFLSRGYVRVKSTGMNKYDHGLLWEMNGDCV